MNKIVALEARKQEPDPEVVAAIEAMLELANVGVIRSIAACYARNTGEITTVLNVSDHHFPMSHAISALWFRFQQRAAENAHQPESDRG